MTLRSQCFHDFQKNENIALFNNWFMRQRAFIEMESERVA